MLITFIAVTICTVAIFKVSIIKESIKKVLPLRMYIFITKIKLNIKYTAELKYIEWRYASESGSFECGHVNLPVFIAHAGGMINDMSYTNSREAFDYNYRLGFRCFEVDLNWTRDDSLVLLHDWDHYFRSQFFGAGRRPTFREFMAFKRRDGLHQFAFSELAQWIDCHADAIIVTDIKERNCQALKKIRMEYPRLSARVIPQVYSFSEFFAVKKNGYHDLILTCYKNLYSDSNLEQFLTFVKPTAVAIDCGRANTTSIHNEYLSLCYIFTVNDSMEFCNFKRKGFRGIYTDELISREHSTYCK